MMQRYLLTAQVSHLTLWSLFFLLSRQSLDVYDLFPSFTNKCCICALYSFPSFPTCCFVAFSGLVWPIDLSFLTMLKVGAMFLYVSRMRGCFPRQWLFCLQVCAGLRKRQDR